MKYEQHLEAVNTLNQIWKDKSKYFVIHYACESFYSAPMAKTPRITAIAIRSFESGQTYSFSMHQEAELLNINTEEIKQNYDYIEFNMLKDFAAFLSKHNDKNWIHWNMRDGNYGFQAIEHRYRILKNKLDPKNKNIQMPIINDVNKYDLSLLLIHKYGPGYIGNPRIKKLMELNKMSPKDFLTGEQEAQAFNDGNFHILLMSTLSKVTLFSHFLQKAIDNDLKNNSRKSDVCDNLKIQISDYITKTPNGIIGFPILTAVLGAFIGYLFSEYL